jgi:SsrA-binding protein
VAKTKDKSSHSPRIANRKARHDYHIDDSLECGVVLQGSEVKSVRQGQVSLAEGFARVEPRTMELWLYGVHIAPYSHATGKFGHDPDRPRKLLAHRREIAKLLGETTSKGTTLVPLAMYFVRGRVKVEVGVARGKKTHDKRQDLKKQEADREMRKAMARRTI